MAALPVEWVLVIYYGPSAHRATYGRLSDTKYTKDYIQLSRTSEFMDAITTLFPVGTGVAGSFPLTLRWWPTESAPGALVFQSADRPHLKWETSLGAPKAWKMTPNPSDATAETIPGNPSHADSAAAENEFALLQKSGAGQPYLLAIKLRDEPRALHLRAYLKNPNKKYAWADVRLLPESIQALIAKTRQSSALAWSDIQSGGEAPSKKVNEALLKLSASDDFASEIDMFDADIGRELADFLQHPAYGVFFDPSRNHNAWTQAAPLPTQVAANAERVLEMLNGRFSVTTPGDAAAKVSAHEAEAKDYETPLGDAAAEAVEVSTEEVEPFREQIENKNYEVSDTHTTVKTRGSAQRAFAEVVKANYGSQCAVTGIKNRKFLVASHIVPWSVDKTIRLDPSNGICLSLLVDRAFENGYLLIDDELTVRVDWDRVGNDDALRNNLQPYDGKKLKAPKSGKPKLDYLQRRRELVKALPFVSGPA
jgi:hypothetical protein